MTENGKQFAEFLNDALRGATGEGAICVSVRGSLVLLTEMRHYNGDDLPQACGRRYFHKLASWPADERAELIADIKRLWPAFAPGLPLATELMARFGKNRLEYLDDDMLRRVRLAISM